MASINDLAEEPQPSGCLSELAWIGASFIQPCFNMTFYERAIKRGVFLAVGFFLLFGFLVSAITTINLSLNLSSFDQEIRASFARGDLPEITIQDGFASVSGPEPFILSEDEPGTLFAVDTSGEIQRIDRSRYVQGILLTRQSLHVLSNGRYQILPLDELQAALATDSIVINEKTATEFWGWFTGVFSILALFGLSFWNLIIRFMFMTALAVFIWGLSGILQTTFEYSDILTIGLYSLVPATYVSALLGLIGIRFLGFQTLILLVVWVFVIIWIHQGRRTEAQGSNLSL